MRKFSLFALAALCLGLAAPDRAPAQPPPPFTIQITSPAWGPWPVPPTVAPPVVITGISGAPNSTVTVKLYDNQLALLATKLAGTDNAGNWSCDFGLRPDGTYAAIATVVTGQSDSTVFFVEQP